ncbi:receptor-interacting serine/threonine-protein kinase 2 [Bufo gargarizans]|uniref:receptor-interacting serine/threonine-protein kinase 2 n=1 Tax=Bufo gargarizans TaxID=30331 RepID=UPI001CF5AAA6|nr:receptor-interacting serine/threonine-protein kinase 2 [Bufo gargarizans]XP_044150765.1 receptor-interacting serine/threonine-protein kinase 2 [Bufo gargarizans]
MNSSTSSTSSTQELDSPSPLCHEESFHTRTECISSNLQVIPYHKLVDLQFINKGAYGTVYSALHSDWRTRVAVKFFPKERHLVDRERKKILKEAEILHKARFSFILSIMGICNEEDNIGIVTEYMPNGSLNQLLHEDNPSPEIVWPLRFRILYEIALGVNFLHNMTPPLLHHDLKTPNILLDSEFHVKIADFGFSQWRKLSLSVSDQNSTGGTIIYMPPEMYEPNIKNSRESVKHDMYSYSIIMWEVLSRKQPYEDAVSHMQIMYCVANGRRPDTSEESLPSDIPHRDLFVTLMQSGWASDPNERPAFLKCLLELEPVIRRYDDISILEGILQIKKTRNNISCISTPSHPVEENIHPFISVQNTCQVPSQECTTIVSKLSCSPDEKEIIRWKPSSDRKPTDEVPFPNSYTGTLVDPEQESPSTTQMWIQQKRDQIINQMTEACLNQCLDALISNHLILKEEYELIRSKDTRCAKVRELIDTCDFKGEGFARIIVQKLKENKQFGLRPFPEI